MFSFRRLTRYRLVQDLKEHDRYVRYHCMGPIHQEYIRKILYIPHNDSIVASSGDYRKSLIITNINQVKQPYIFRLYKVSAVPCVCLDIGMRLSPRVANVSITARS